MYNKSIAVFLPYVGMAHQDYLWRFYQGLAPLSKFLMCYDTVQDVRWDGFQEDPICLTPRSTIGRGCQKIYKEILPYLSIGNRKRLSYVFPPPLGWEKKIFESISNKNIGVVIVVYGAAALALLPFFKGSDVKLIVNFGGSDFQMSDHYRWYKTKLHELSQRADHCVFTSKFLMQQAVSRGCPAEKSSYIYRGRALSAEVKRKHSKKASKFVTVANLFPVKGHFYLIEAFRHVCDQISHCSLSLYGDGYEYNKLLDQVKRLQLEGKVKFKGKRGWKEVQGDLNEYDIYVQPSVKARDGQEEGLSQATMEAVSKGMPVIVTDSGGLPEIIEHGYNGIIVRQKDSKALANAMVTLAGDYDKRCCFSKNSIIRSEKLFDSDRQHLLWKNLLATYL